MNQKLKELVDYLLFTKNDANILIIGDVILDERYEVAAEKISQEAPIVITKSSSTKPDSVSYGGACNVARQIQHLGIKTELIAMLRNKDVSAINKQGIKVENYIPLIGDEHISTKKRFYKDGTMVSRWDIERDLCGMPKSELKDYHNDILDYVKYGCKASVVVLSDYNKGVFSENFAIKLLKILKEKNIPSIVDPKKAPLSKWSGATIIKPNGKEAYELTGESDWRKQCKVIIRETGCKSVIITLEGNSVVGIDLNGKEFEFYPNKKVHPLNISGAGDTYISYTAYSLLFNFMSFMEMIELAFTASSIYVQNYIPKTITLNEIKKYLDPIGSKYVKPIELKSRDFALTMTNGCYDLLTGAHLESFKFAKTQGNKLVVALNSDESVKRLKGPTRPITPLEERMALVAALEYVDYVVSFDEDTPLEIIKIIQPDLIVKGGYKVEDVVGNNLAKVVICPTFPCLSTTEKIKKLANEFADKNSREQ